MVATPIGNLGDLSLRAIATLKAVTRIAAEDTRTAQHLLNHYHIQKPLLSLHQFNESERIDAILSYLSQGEDIALISDAGTPLISDPGYLLVKAIRARQGKVIPIPGACALIAALSASGLSTARFAFDGFLPAKSAARQAQLLTLLHDARTLIFYESPHRIMATLNDLRTVFGDSRQIVIGRELTKLYEEFIIGSASEILQRFEARPETERGEMVILVEGASAEKVEEEGESERILRILLDELPTKQAVNLTSKMTGARKNALYDIALRYRTD